MKDKDNKDKKKKPTSRHNAPQTNVVLLNDDSHSYLYVTIMLVKVCGVTADEAIRMTEEVDKKGRVIVWTGHKEYAEFKQERINNWGRDENVAHSVGSMSAILVTGV